ncbi:VWA domain-containing protein [Leadbetterella sp. DM7]|uniref:VWA domain-containing protein n=1 Tax=Leadbetterella sp. DM7 TaxID=3235085 RepID=UPI00349EEE8D
MNWFSPYWFYPKTLLSFYWANVYLLWLLGLVPFFFFLKWVFSSHRKQTLLLSVEGLAGKRGLLVKFRFLVPLFFMMGVGCLVLAIARPQLPGSGSENFTEGVDIAIAVDISESMLARDLQPNRLEAAKNIGRRFIEGRINDRIALVAFAGETVTLSPLTTDYVSLKEYLADLSTDLVKTSGTAIGTALASCVNKLRDVPGKSRVAIIISDGDNTAGAIPPETALELARSFGVRVYTIAIGKPGSDEVVDEKTLRMLAGGPEGRFFQATDNTALTRIFDQIDHLEKSLAESARVYDMTDYYYQYLNWGILFFLMSLFLRFTFLGNLLED